MFCSCPVLFIQPSPSHSPNRVEFVFLQEVTKQTMKLYRLLKRAIYCNDHIMNDMIMTQKFYGEEKMTFGRADTIYHQRRFRVVFQLSYPIITYQKLSFQFLKFQGSRSSRLSIMSLLFFSTFSQVFQLSCEFIYFCHC